MQGLPVVTRFLAQFLPFWNEKDFFAEVIYIYLLVFFPPNSRTSHSPHFQSVEMKIINPPSENRILIFYIYGLYIFYYFQILGLVEWLNIEDVEHISVIMDTLSKIFYRAQPMEQCAILRSLTTMYTNLVRLIIKILNPIFLDGETIM